MRMSQMRGGYKYFFTHAARGVYRGRPCSDQSNRARPAIPFPTSCAKKKDARRFCRFLMVNPAF